ncbi:MAG: hypothetical protein IPO95_16630 [Rhodanobacteraceae bacterium]|nr:hypothetical protein [Rhodanobacteraceae bacterium]
MPARSSESAISLPAPTVDLAAIGASPTPLAPVDKLGIRVLFVDDSASIRLAYKQLLDRNGYDCDTAGTITEKPSTRPPPDTMTCSSSTTSCRTATATSCAGD